MWKKTCLLVMMILAALPCLAQGPEIACFAVRQVQNHQKVVSVYSELVLTDRNGSAPTVILTTTSPMPNHPRWSPDMDTAPGYQGWILFTDTYTLRKIPVTIATDGAVTWGVPVDVPVNRPTGFHIYYADWSPKGDWIAFFGASVSEGGIYLVGTEGGDPVQVVYSIDGNTFPQPWRLCWDPSGTWLAYTWRTSSASNELRKKQVIDENGDVIPAEPVLDPPSVQRLIIGGNSVSPIPAVPSWSSRGEIAWATAGPPVVTTKGRKTTTTQPPSDLYNVSANTAATDIKNLTPVPGTLNAHDCSWSPDGNSLAFYNNTLSVGIMILDRASGDIGMLLADSLPYLYYKQPAWRPALLPTP